MPTPISIAGSLTARKGDLDRAIGDFTKAIKLKPGFACAYACRGLAYNDKDDYDRAIGDYDRAIETET